MAYTFGRSYHRLEVPDFDPANHESMHEGSKMLTLMTHAILLFRTIQSLPEFLLSRMGYELATLVELKNVGSLTWFRNVLANETTTRVCEGK
jgi:hypothetical protein